MQLVKPVKSNSDKHRKTAKKGKESTQTISICYVTLNVPMVRARPSVQYTPAARFFSVRRMFM